MSIIIKSTNHNEQINRHALRIPVSVLMSIDLPQYRWVLVNDAKLCGFMGSEFHKLLFNIIFYLDAGGIRACS